MYSVRNWFKIISCLLVSLVVIGAITMLAIRYFDVLVRGFDAFRDAIARKKARFFGGKCCDFDDEEEDLAEI